MCSNVLKFTRTLGKCSSPYEKLSACHHLGRFERNQGGSCPQVGHSLAAWAQEEVSGSKSHLQDIGQYFLVSHLRDRASNMLHHHLLPADSTLSLLQILFLSVNFSLHSIHSILMSASTL